MPLKFIIFVFYYPKKSAANWLLFGIRILLNLAFICDAAWILILKNETNFTLF